MLVKFSKKNCKHNGEKILIFKFQMFFRSSYLAGFQLVSISSNSKPFSDEDSASPMDLSDSGFERNF